MIKLPRPFIAATTSLLLLLSLLALTGCTTTTTDANGTHPRTKPAAATPFKDSPETVLVSYHVKPGMEMIFEHLLSQAWQAYRKEHLVLASPHYIVRQPEQGGTSGYIEVFSWVDHAAPEKTSNAIKELWSQEKNLCENRGGQPGLGGGEVLLIVPSQK